VANLFQNDADPTFADLYRVMSEQDLQDLLSDWHSLISEARSALAVEFATRGLEFVEPPPPADDTPPEFRDLTTIRRYRDLSEVLVARAVIESAGIFCFLKDENLVRLDWQVSNFIGGIRIQVAAADVEAAGDILSQPIPREISIPDQPGFIQPRCSRCTSTDISWERQGRKAALASLYLFSIPLPRGSESWHCNSCDLRWIDDEPEETASNSNSTRDSQP
jgi:hypothetical protein